MKDTHPQVKFDVFERLNTGAVELAAQDLRHGLYHGTFVEWIGRTAKDVQWRELVHAGTNKRMKAEELLVRFLTFHSRLEHYEKPLASFLNNFTEEHRDASDDVLADFRVTFERAAAVIATIFSNLAFAISDSRMYSLSPSPGNSNTDFKVSRLLAPSPEQRRAVRSLLMSQNARSPALFGGVRQMVLP